jgi:hypothetical protein
MFRHCRDIIREFINNVFLGYTCFFKFQLLLIQFKKLIFFTQTYIGFRTVVFKIKDYSLRTYVVVDFKDYSLKTYIRLGEKY